MYLIKRGSTTVGPWPELSAIVGRPIKSDNDSAKSWDYVRLACESVGGDARQAPPGMAAIFYLQVGIGLVDDVLDDDPKGLHLELGAGRAANLGLACQALASEMLTRAEIPESRRYLLHEILVRGALATARGQEIDVLLSDKVSEADYWRLTDAKTPPLFSAALALGALLGGADAERARGVGDLGAPLGRMIQIGDDLTDALDSNQRPDWQRPGANLPMVFALLAEYDGRDRFHELLPRLSEGSNLAEAQRLLVSSGAIGYCCHRLLAAHKDVRTQLDQLHLPQAELLEHALDRVISPLTSLLDKLGFQASDLLRPEVKMDPEM